MGQGRNFTKALPPLHVLQALFAYCAETGALILKRRPVEMFHGPTPAIRRKAQRRWNTLFAGKPAGGLNGSGYLYTRIDGSAYLVHRIAWGLAHGTLDPATSIDHINGNPLDNRLINLRAVDHRSNMVNRRLSKNNTSGHHGVHLDKRRGTWAARIRKDGRYAFLGEYRSKEEAIEVRKAAEAKLGFHPGHGRQGC